MDSIQGLTHPAGASQKNQSLDKNRSLDKNQIFMLVDCCTAKQCLCLCVKKAAKPPRGSMMCTAKQNLSFCESIVVFVPS